MRVMLLAIVVACGAPPKPAPVAPPAAPTRDLAVAEPPPKPATPPGAPLDPDDPRLTRHEWLLRNLQRPPSPMTGPIRRGPGRPPETLDVASADLWSPCVREFVRAQAAHARRALTAAFARHAVTCDAERRVVVSPPHDHRGKPYVAYAGTFAPERSELTLQIATCGATTSIDRLVVLYRAKRWTTTADATERRDGCIVASVPDSRPLRRMLRDAIDARDMFVRFDDANAVDLPVTAEMKRDLRLMLDAYEAVTAP